ncbi:MAG: ASCH domain-containing protein [Candidatus Saccharimonas sp.]
MTEISNKTIGFAPELVPLVLNGSKTLTYRVGDKYNFLQVGDKIMTKNSSTGKIFAQLEITGKEIGTFGTLRDDRAGHEVYRSTQERRETFEKYYKRPIGNDEPATIIGFKVIKKVVEPVNFEGVIIDESLTNKSVLNDVDIISTKIVPVTEHHKTPWVKQWTMYTIEIAADKAAEVADKISTTLDKDHDWYADFKTETEHYVIYEGKVFHITDRTDKKQYDEASSYGVSIGIPDYQVDFSPHLKQWQR